MWGGGGMREHKNTSTSCSRVTSTSLSLQNERSTRKANTDPHGAWTRNVYRRAPSHIGARLENCLSRDKACQAMSKARTVANVAGSYPGIITEHARGYNRSPTAVTGRKADTLGRRSAARAAALWALSHTTHSVILEAGEAVAHAYRI